MRVLGLDIGSTSIKAVEIESSFRRFEVKNYHELRVRDGEDPNLMAANLLGSLPQPPDKIIVAIPTRETTLRNLPFPTRDKKAIQNAIEFELEDDLPIELEELVTEHVIVPTMNKEVNVHIAAIRRSTLAQTIERLSEVGIEPDTITTEAWAFRSLIGKAYSEPVLHLHLGKKHSLISIHSKRNIHSCVEVLWGSDTLNQALEVFAGISPHDSEKVKIEKAMILTDEELDRALEEDKRISEAIIQGLSPLLTRLHQALLGSKNLIGEIPKTLLLSGAPSSLPGLDWFLSERLRIEVKPFSSLSSIQPETTRFSVETDRPFALAAALAFSGSNQEKKVPLLNFRKGDFSKSGSNRSIDWITVKDAAQFFILPIFTFVLWDVSHRLYLTSESEKTDKLLEKEIKTFFPDLSKGQISSYVRDPSRLQSTIRESMNKNKQLENLVSTNLNHPLAPLNKLSSEISKSTVVDFLEFNVKSSPSPYLEPSENTLSAVVQVDDLQTAEKLKLSFGKIGNFEFAPARKNENGKFQVSIVGTLNRGSK